jgi:molecular chaperone GrpE
MPDRSIHPRTHIRNVTDGGDAAARSASPGAGQPGQDESALIDRLSAELEEARGLAAEHLASLQRTAADFANFKRRTAEDRERELGLASESLLRKVLGVADDFDRALEALPAEYKGAGWIEGIVLVDRKLRSLLESEGVTPIESVGRPFDPREHEAIASIPGTGRPEGEVVAEVQRGYRVRDRVLRPAMVTVATGGDSARANIN